MKRFIALVVLVVVFALAGTATAQTPFPDPTPDVAAPGSGAIIQSTAVPVVIAPSGASDVIWGMEVSELVTFIISVSALLFAIGAALFAVIRGASLAETNEQLTQLIKNSTANPDLMTPAENLYEGVVLDGQRDKILDAVEALERLAKLLPNTPASAGVEFVKEIVDGKPVTEKIKEQDAVLKAQAERLEELEKKAASADSDFGGYTVTMDAPTDDS